MGALPPNPRGISKKKDASRAPLGVYLFTNTQIPNTVARAALTLENKAMSPRDPCLIFEQIASDCAPDRTLNQINALLTRQLVS